eukprot:scaffold23831_cov30-Tisochrysis_lutea.AAC.8
MLGAPRLSAPPVMMLANLLLSLGGFFMTSKMSVAMRETFVKVTRQGWADEGKERAAGEDA